MGFRTTDFVSNRGRSAIDRLLSNPPWPSRSGMALAVTDSVAVPAIAPKARCLQHGRVPACGVRRLLNSEGARPAAGAPPTAGTHSSDALRLSEPSRRTGPELRTAVARVLAVGAGRGKSSELSSLGCEARMLETLSAYAAAARQIEALRERAPVMARRRGTPASALEARNALRTPSIHRRTHTPESKPSLALRPGYDPDDLHAISEIAYHYLKNGGPEWARRLYEGLDAVAPDNPQVALGLGLVHGHLREIDAAAYWYQEAGRRDPGEGRADINLAELHLSRREWDRAHPLLESGHRKAVARGESALGRKARALLEHIRDATPARAEETCPPSCPSSGAPRNQPRSAVRDRDSTRAALRRWSSANPHSHAPDR